ncbi:uncharacterized protein TNCV_2106431 [Trichonephila clavipes]|nr:uncharacterized protein TNCV_2106431 [Trichonephila clavipes]
MTLLGRELPSGLASVSRLEGLGSMPDDTNCPRSTCSLNQRDNSDGADVTEFDGMPRSIMGEKNMPNFSCYPIMKVHMGYSTSGGQIDCQISCPSALYIVIKHQTCDPRTNVHHDHSQTADTVKCKLVPTAMLLMSVQCHTRLQWCLTRSGINPANWGRIVFSDESRFLLCSDDHRRRVLRRPGQRATPGPL